MEIVCFDARIGALVVWNSFHHYYYYYYYYYHYYYYYDYPVAILVAEQCRPSIGGGWCGFGGGWCAASWPRTTAPRWRCSGWRRMWRARTTASWPASVADGFNEAVRN